MLRTKANADRANPKASIYIYHLMLMLLHSLDGQGFKLIWSIQLIKYCFFQWPSPHNPSCKVFIQVRMGLKSCLCWFLFARLYLYQWSFSTNRCYQNPMSWSLLRCFSHGHRFLSQFLGTSWHFNCQLSLRWKSVARIGTYWFVWVLRVPHSSIGLIWLSLATICTQ